MRNILTTLHFTLAIVVCLAFLPLTASADAVLLLSTGSSALDAQIRDALQTGGHVVTIGSIFTRFAPEEIAGHDVVMLVPSLDSGDGNISLAGQNALVKFVSEGGGLVTTEWTIWMSSFQSFQILKTVFPVMSSQSYSESLNPVTYSQVVPNPTINRGLPQSLTIPTDFYYGTETFFAARPGATVFYNSFGAAGGAGVVGWQYGAGRVIQFSTLFGQSQIFNTNAQQLLANAVEWAGQIITDITFTPDVVRTGSSFTAEFKRADAAATAFLDIRFRAPGGTTDEVVLNWQQGSIATHQISRTSGLGMWTVTGVRSHADKEDHSGTFDPANTNLTVISAPLVTGMQFEPSSVVVGGSSAARFLGTDLSNSTYFDVRVRAPGSSVEEIVLNWQQGIVGNHATTGNTTPGNWTITGVRGHENRDDHTGDFDPVLATLAVTPSNCVVTTSSGDAYGVDMGASCAFLGIPYAASPIGNLRWKPPQPAVPWFPTLLNATVPPPNCPSIASGQPTGLEDCLKLNVWIPKSTSGNSAPVIVWLHTGGFVAASANFAGHNGRSIAERYGVIVVAPNYRLGPFGFLAHPALTNETPGYHSSGNYGFLDQRAAMVWVRDNIASFGGDPRRITIGGQSAGAHSVSLHLISPGSTGLFHRALMESGFSSPRWRTRNDAELQGHDFAIALGCTDSSQVLSCIRTKSQAQVLRALTTGREEFNEAPGIRWNPVVDGIDIPDQPRVLYERGAFNKVPMILGVTREEGWTFVDRSFPTGITTTQFEAAINREFEFAAPLFLTQYRPENFPSAKEALAQLTGDVEFVCEAVRVARLAARTGNPVYLYSFEYVVDGLAGNHVIHGLGTNFLFGNDFVGANPGAHPLDAKDLQLSSAMMGYWARFAAGGDPNENGPSTSVPWPLFDPRRVPGIETNKYLVLDSVIQSRSGLRHQQCDFLEPFFFGSVVGATPAGRP